MVRAQIRKPQQIKTAAPLATLQPGAVIQTQKHGNVQITGISAEGQLTVQPYTGPIAPPIDSMPPPGFDARRVDQRSPQSFTPHSSGAPTMTPPLSIDSQPPFTTPDALQFQGPTPAPQQAQTRTGGEFYVLLYNQGGQHQGIHWAKSDAAGNLTFLRGGEEPRLNNPAHFQQLRQKLIASQMPQSAIVCYMESGMVWNQENIYGIAGAKLQWDGVPVTALEAPPSNIQQHDTYTLPGQPPTPPPRLGQRPPQTFVTSGPIANIACNTATTPLTWMACKVANKPMSNMPMSTVVCSWIIGLPGAIAGAIVGGIVGFFVGIVDAIRFRNPKFILNGMAGFALTGATWLSFLSGGFIGFFGAALVSRARG